MITVCGGLVLDEATLAIVDGTIVAKGTDAIKGSVAANCGGIKFCTDDFKLVGKTITSVKTEEADVVPTKVTQQGCGCILVDTSCFELDNGKLVFNKPADPVPSQTEDEEQPTQ